jgi:hypothetical protein
MSAFEIPMGPASVFTLILIGYFVLTVWFGKPQPVVQVKAQINPPQPAQAPQAERTRDLNAG